MFRGTFDFTAPEFDWGPGYQRPNLPQQDLVIYEARRASLCACCALLTVPGLRAALSEVECRAGAVQQQQCNPTQLGPPSPAGARALLHSGRQQQPGARTAGDLHWPGRQGRPLLPLLLLWRIS